MNSECDEPIGELTLRTLAMPADTNPSGDLFGGWLLAQMDIAGGILAKQRAAGRVATLAVDGRMFHKPVFVGEVVCCYAHVERVGTTSMSIRIQAWAIRAERQSERAKVTEGVFTYVAIGVDRRPRPIGN